MTIAFLGARSDFSLGESLLSPEDIAAAAVANGYVSASITDTMNVSALVRFSKACDKASVKPIIGCRLRIVDDALDKTPAKKRENKNREFFVTVYVRNNIGLGALYELLTKAYSDAQFYYVPRLSLSDVASALSTGGLLVASGDVQGAFSHPQGVGYWRTLTSASGAANAFLTLCPINTPLFARTNELAIREHLETGVRLVITRPSFYASVDDADTLDVLTTITDNMKMSDPWRPIPYVRDFRPMDIQTLAAEAGNCHRELSQRFPHDGNLWGHALINMAELIGHCNYKWERQEISLPQMATDEIATLKSECIAGWQSRLLRPQLGYRPTDLKPYAERLVYELGVLEKMGFVGYFLLVQDTLRWAKENGIRVGPGRGSAAGSLVAYLLGITDIDPIRFGLIFERFLNPDRVNWPDIDFDIMTSRRNDVVQYLVNKYGADRVAGITNYSTLASASALRDTARVSELPTHDYDCTKLVPKIHGTSHDLETAASEVPEIAAFKVKYPTLWNHAVKLQGKMRSFGTHAAGVCVAGEPLVKRAPVITRTGFPAIAFDRLEVEDQGLLKLDVLGLSTLDIHRIALDLIEKNHGVRVDLVEIPLDDPKTLQAFSSGSTTACFQFEGGASKGMLRDMSNGRQLGFDSVAACTALNRPGPLDAGAAAEYIKVQRGEVGFQRWHPKIDPIMAETNGVLVFQETLMKLATDAAGMKMSEADGLRAIVGKKRVDKMAEQKDRLVAGFVAGWVTVEMEDGSARTFHKMQKMRVKEVDGWLTVDEVIDRGYTLLNA